MCFGSLFNAHEVGLKAHEVLHLVSITVAEFFTGCEREGVHLLDHNRR